MFKKCVVLFMMVFLMTYGALMSSQYSELRRIINEHENIPNYVKEQILRG